MAPSAPILIKGSATRRVHARVHAAEMLVAEGEKLDKSRAFLIAGRTLAETTPHVRAIRQALGTRHAGTFTGISPHTPLEDVAAAVNAARDAGADLIVTIGGGAQTDAGKIAALALKQGVTDAEGLLALSARCGWDRIDLNDPALSPDVPVICVPTTLSGGEFNEGSGASDAAGRKHPFLHRDSAPVAIILDPWLALDTPEWLWLSTGVRALDHAVETLASLESNPYCDAMAQAAIRLLAPALRRTKADPSDIEARSEAQIGVSLAMVPLIAGVPMGASHAIGHALGTTQHVAHGHTSCILMPAVQRWNASAIPERHRLIGEALGDAQMPVGDLLAALIRELGQPGSLASISVPADDATLHAIAELAFPAPWIASNPRPISSPEDIVSILRAVTE